MNDRERNLERILHEVVAASQELMPLKAFKELHDAERFCWAMGQAREILGIFPSKPIKPLVGPQA